MANASDRGVQLDVLCPIGPCLAYHVGWIAEGGLYIHGGIAKVGSNLPTFRLHRFDFGSGTWFEVQAANSPALSHHACVVASGRYAVIVGGWNGHQRTADIHVFDVVSSRWSSPQTEGFPVGSGLSSHAAVMLASGDIVVIGREGSLRMQRKSSTMFLLRGDPSAADSGVFAYSELPQSVTSRSGHSLHVAGSTLIVIGGRNDGVVEKHVAGKSPDDVPCEPVLQLRQRITKVTSKPMSGRKQHASAGSSGVVFVHGGWTFDGKSRDPVGEMYALLVKAGQWIYLGESGVRRAGHVCCWDATRVVMHGGEGPRGAVYGTLHQLVVNS